MTRMSRYTLLHICRAAAFVVLAVLVFGACDVHEYPEEGDIMPAMLHLRFNTAMADWNVNTLASETPLASTRSSGSTSGTMRYVVRLYPLEADAQVAEEIAPVKEYTFTRNVSIPNYDTDFHLDIAPGKYAVKVWADFVVDNSTYYDVTDFHNIELQGSHVGNTDMRDAFRGIDTLTVVGTVDEPVDVEETIAMRRPLAKFEFVSSDLQEFFAKEASNIRSKLSGSSKEDIHVDLSEFNVVFYYQGYMPDTYNMFSDRPIDSKMGVAFGGSLSQLSDDEVSLGFDYVLVNPSGGSVMVQAAIFNAEGEVVSLTSPVDVPLKRDVHTIIRGKFLTQSATGGMSIDPAFSGDYNVVVP